MNALEQRLEQIRITCASLSDEQTHGISALLSIICFTKEPHVRESAEKCIQAFITRKKLGQPCNLWLIRDEFGIGVPAWTEYFKNKKTVDGD